MPLLLNTTFNEALVGVWEITEPTDFFEQAIAYRSNASNPGQRLQQLASRMVLDSLYPGFPFGQIILNPVGKPILEIDAIQFSISHTKGFAAAIVAEEIPVGIDIESISPRVLKVEKKFLNQHEFMLLERLKAEDRIVFASLFWSIKEAVYKCWGKGGVDFSNDIRIMNFERMEKGLAELQFGEHQEVYTVYYQRIGEVWLSHMLAHIK